MEPLENTEKQQNNPENQPEKAGVGKLLYIAAVGILAVVMMVAGVLYFAGGLPADQAASVPTDYVMPTFRDPNAPAPTVSASTQPPVETGNTDIRLNLHSEPVSLLSQAARDYLAETDVEDVSEFVSRYWEIESRSDLGRPVELSYTVYALPEGVEVEQAVFRLFNGDGYEEYIPAPGSQKVALYNLMTGAEYRYSAIITLSDGTSLTLPGSFRTAPGPRLMNIGGLVNVRDVGGWVTADGKTVKQGVLYRGSEMDGFFEKKFKLTDEGWKQMQALGIKTDFDLRHDGSDALEGVHNYYDACQYEQVFSDYGREAVRRLFADLAKPEHYPVYLHCTYGADRTGTMCYLLLGLLGVSDEDLMRDYELTAMYYDYVSPEQMGAFVQKINDLPGENTQAKVEYFLRSAGVTQGEMDSIRQIFLGWE